MFSLRHVPPFRMGEDAGDRILLHTTNPSPRLRNTRRSVFLSVYHTHSHMCGCTPFCIHRLSSLHDPGRTRREDTPGGGTTLNSCSETSFSLNVNFFSFFSSADAFLFSDAEERGYAGLISTVLLRSGSFFRRLVRSFQASVVSQAAASSCRRSCMTTSLSI